MIKICILLLSCIISLDVFCQSLAVNTDGSTANASSILDVKSTAKGMLIPRMSKTEKNAIASPATGLLVFQASPDSIGFHYYNGTSWIWMPGADQLNTSSWRLIGNSGTSPATNFIGTTDNQPLAFRTFNTEKMRLVNGNLNNGLLGVGMPYLPAATLTSIDPYATIMALGNGANDGDIVTATAANTPFSGYFISAKARGTHTTPTIVQTGDQISGFEAWGWDGTKYTPGAGIISIIDATPGINDMPAALTFNTTNDGSFLTTERMRISNNGNVGIGTTANTAALFDVSSTSKGILLPRIALTATNAAAPVTLPPTSLLVYNTSTAGTAPNNVVPGYYYNAGTDVAPNWTRIENGGNDWHTTGNSGTTPATNFMGTTDAQDFVLKTSGSAAANERLRVIGAGATPGQVVVNNTGIFSGDAFSVYANNTTNGTTTSINNTLGTFAVNGYSSGNGTGVYGEVNGGASSSGTSVWGNYYGTATTASSTSEAIWGTNSTAPAGTGATAAVATALRGDASGAAGTAFTMGVLGVNSGTAGAAFGVYGQTSSAAATGVFGVNLDVTANPSHGIQGQTAALGSAAGVRGFSTATTIAAGQNAFGVRGTANGVPSGTGFVMGIRGDVSSTTGATYGLYGQSASATGFGTDAVNTNASGTGLLVIGNNSTGTYLGAGTGAAINGNGIGTFSIAKTAASGIGVVGIGNNLTGSIITPTSGAGVAGTGTQYGVMGFATTVVSTIGTNTSTTNAAAASAGGYFEVQSAGVPQTWAYVGVRDNGAVLRKIIGPGTVNTIVKDLDNKIVALSAPEAPENLFQDYGQSKLINGRVHVDIDPIFAKNIVVNEKHPLRVFVQLEGDCKGVYVTNKTQSGFDVVELDGGQSNTAFSYSLIANRADEVNPDGSIAHYSNERFPAAPGPQEKVKAETKEALSTEILNANTDSPAQTIPQLPKKEKKKKLSKEDIPAKSK